MLDPMRYEAEEEEEEEDEGTCKKEDKDEDASLTSKLLKTRTILLSDEINKKLAHKVISQLLLLEQDDADAPIKMFIDSPGGDADAGFAIHDMIRFIKPKVKCICAGLTASAAVIVLLGSSKRDRLSLPNARLLMHQPQTTIMGHASDIDIEASEIVKIRDRINKLIAEETGQPMERIQDDTARNFWMSASEAKEYGLVNKIISRRSELE